MQYKTVWLLKPNNGMIVLESSTSIEEFEQYQLGNRIINPFCSSFDLVNKITMILCDSSISQRV